MPDTPNYGFPFPSLSDPPNVPADLEALAEAVDATLDDELTAAGVGDAHITHGTAQADGSGAITLTWPAGTYASAPTVVATVVEHNNALVRRRSGATATSVPLTVNRTETPYTVVGGAYINWIAIGPRP